MAAKQKIILRYYQLQPHGDSPNFTPIDLKDRITKLSTQKEFKSLDYHGNTLVLFNNQIDIKNGLFFGAIISNQMTGIPPRMDVNTSKLRPLTRAMNEDEGLAVETCFLLDPETNILVVESKRGGARATGVISWIAYNISVGRLHSAAVINPNALERFLKMDKVVQFELKMAKITGGDFLSESVKNRTLEDVISIADSTDSEILTFKLSTDGKSRRGFSRNSLSIKKIQEFAKSAIGYKGDAYLEKLEATGYTIDGAKLTIDLIEDEIWGEIRVDKGEDSRFVSSFRIQDHFSEIMSNYNKTRPPILSTYRIK